MDDPEFQQQEASCISVGDRCEVQPGAKRGFVRWLPSLLLFPLMLQVLRRIPYSRRPATLQLGSQ